MKLNISLGIRNWKLEILLLSMLLIFPVVASGATLTASGLDRDAILSETFSVDIALTILGEQVNAIEADVLYDRDILYLEEIREDNSAISLWLARPEMEEEGMIRFSGVIPGGSPLAQTPLVTLVFKPLKTGTARVWFQNARAFLNDGAGTEAPLSFTEYRVSVIKNTLTSTDSKSFDDEQPARLRDTEPPEVFQPEIGRDESVYGGKWFVAFSAVDRGSGIDHYEILEKYHVVSSKYQGKAEGEWVIVESPYLLRDQKLRSYIYVKAVDRNGNEYIAVVDPVNSAHWYLWIIITVIIAGSFVLWKHRKQVLNS